MEPSLNKLFVNLDPKENQGLDDVPDSELDDQDKEQDQDQEHDEEPTIESDADDEVEEPIKPQEPIQPTLRQSVSTSQPQRMPRTVTVTQSDKSTPDLFKGNFAFQDAMAGTLPEPAEAPAQTAPEEPQYAEPAPLEETADEDGEEITEGENKPPGNLSSAEVERRRRNDILHDIYDFMGQGINPPMKPSPSMSTETLEGLLTYQVRISGEKMMANLLGYGWLQTVRLIETVNNFASPKLLPKDKQLKLNGVTDMVGKNMKLYKPFFRAMAKKMPIEKFAEWSPYIGFIQTTVDLFAKTHQANVMKEGRNVAASASSMASNFKNTLDNPPPKEDTASEPVPKQPTIIDPASITIPADDTASDGDVDADNAPAADDGSDSDEVTVELPQKSRRGRSQSRKQ